MKRQLNSLYRCLTLRFRHPSRCLCSQLRCLCNSSARAAEHGVCAAEFSAYEADCGACGDTQICSCMHITLMTHTQLTLDLALGQPPPLEPYKIQANLFAHAYDTDVTHVLMLAPALGQVLHPKRTKYKQICSRKHMTLMKHMHLTLDLALGQVHFPHHTKYISKSVHART